MPTRFYLRNIVSDLSAPAAEQSTSLPVGTGNSESQAPLKLDTAIGSGQIPQIQRTSVAISTQQSGKMRTFISAGLAAQTIDAGNWTFAFAADEGNNAANCFLALAVYVWNPTGGTKRGTIYDSSAALGTEWATAEQGRVVTIAGSALAISAGDRLVVEVWYVATQAMSTSYTNGFYIEGTTPPVDGSNTSDAASYIEHPGTINFTAQQYSQSVAGGITPTSDRVKITSKRNLVGAFAPFDPATHPNRLVWLRAHSETFADNDLVSAPTDLTGRGNAPTSSGTNQPTFKTGIVNGKSVYRFTTDDHFAFADILSGLTQGEVFIVYKTPASGAANQLWAMGAAGDAYVPFTDGVIYDEWGSTTRKTTGVPAADPGTQFIVYNVVSKPGEWTSRINGVQHYTTASNTVGWQTAPFLGKNLVGGGQYTAAVDVGDIYISTAELTSSERAQFLAELYSFYGISGSGGASGSAISGDVTSTKLKAVSPSGTISSIVGAIVKQTRRRETGGLAPGAGILVKAITRRNLVGAITPAGAIVRQARRSLTGSITPAGALSRFTTRIRTVSGAITSIVGALRREARRSFAGSITPAGAIVRQARKSFAGSATPAGALVRQGRKNPAGALTPAGALARAVNRIRTLSGAITPTGNLAAQKTSQTFEVALGGAIALAAALVRQIRQSPSGSLTPAGDALRRLTRSITAALTPAGAVSRLTGKRASGSIAPAATVSRRTTKNATAAITPAAGIIRRAARALAGAITPESGNATGPTISDPSEIAGLIVDIDPDVVAQADGTAVASIVDKVGGHEFTAIGTAQPLLALDRFNGHAALRFDASNDGMSNAGSTFTLPAAYTIIAIYAHRSSTSAFRRVINGVGANWLIGPYSGKHQAYNGGFFSNAPNTVVDEAVVAAVNQVSGASDFYVNNVLRASRVPSTFPSRFGLGTQGGFAEPADADLGRVLVLDHMWTADERDALNAWAGSHFGIASLIVTGSGGLVRRLYRAISASVTPAGAVSRLTVRAQGGSIAPVAAIVRHAVRNLVASLTPAGDLSYGRRIVHAIDGALGMSGTVSIGRAVVTSGSITPAGSLRRTVTHWMMATLTPAGALRRELRRQISGSVTPAGSIVRAITRRISAGISPSGSIVKLTVRRPAGAITPAGLLRRSLARSITAALAPAGAVRRELRRQISGAISPAAMLRRAITRQLAGSFSPAGSIVRLVVRPLSGSGTLSGTLSMSTAKALAASLTPAAVLHRVMTKPIEGSVGIGGAIERQISRTIEGAIIVAGEMAWVIEKLIGGVLSMTSDLDVTRAGVKQIGGSISPVGWLDTHRNNVRSFVATITPAGDLTKLVTKFLTGSITPKGKLGRWIVGVGLPSIRGAIASFTSWVGSFRSRTTIRGENKSEPRHDGDMESF